MRNLAAAALAALLATAGVASAATISFNVDTGWTSGARTFTNGTDSVSVDAFTYGNNLRPTDGNGTFLASYAGLDGGLGICSDTTTTRRGTVCSDSSHQVDGRGDNEVAVFNFGSRVVRLTHVTFAAAYTGSDDEFDLFNFGNGIGAVPTASRRDIDITGCGWYTCTVNVSALGYIGSIFGIGAFESDDDFKIRAISFEDVAPSVVPLPAAGWGLIAGLGALAALKRRRKAA